jgi:hypothetical protein
MDIIMVFTLLAEFRGVEEEIAQMCLGPKEVMLKKPKESSQHLKLLYVQGHIDGRLIYRMLIDSGTAINLMPYSMFKKLGWEDNELVKTNLTLNGVGDNSMELEVSSPWISPWGPSCSLPRSLSLRCKVIIVLFLVMIGFMPIIMSLLLCTSS